MFTLLFIISGMLLIDKFKTCWV